MRAVLLASVVALGCTGAVAAAPVTYYGLDAGAAPGSAHPNSAAAQASFIAAAAMTGSLAPTIDFEALTVGYASSIAVAAGVTANFSSVDRNYSGIKVNGPAFAGYNTDQTGSKYLSIYPRSADDLINSVTFSFASPINAFGLFLTGVGTNTAPIFLVFDDGTSQSISITGAASGGILFAGFTDAERFISSVSISEIRTNRKDAIDDFGIDDVIYANAFTNVPEPTSLALLGVGVAGIAAARRRRAA